jgi:hypothetical protein
MSAVRFKQIDTVTGSDMDVETRTISNVTNPSTNDQAANKAYVDGIASSPTTLDKARNPSATSGNGSTTGLAISATPSHDSYVNVSINGVSCIVGDGIKTKDCYFSGDGGTTARNIADIVSGDVLYWNGIISDFDLITGDEVDFFFETASGTTTEALPTDAFVSTSPYAMVTDTEYYYCNTTSTAIIMNLPAISSATRQIIFNVKLDTKPGSNNVTITPNGSDTVEGVASLVISTEKVSYTIRCPSTGTDWKFH